MRNIVLSAYWALVGRLLAVEIFAVHILMLSITGDAVRFICPGAQVDQFATFAAEGAVGVLFGPFNGGSAGWAGHYAGCV